MRFPDRSSADIAVPLSIYLPFFIFIVYFWYSSQTKLKKQLFKILVSILHVQDLGVSPSPKFPMTVPIPQLQFSFNEWVTSPLQGGLLSSRGTDTVREDWDLPCSHRGKSLCRDEWLLVGPVLLQHRDKNGNPLRPSARVQTQAWKITTSICVCV